MRYLQRRRIINILVCKASASVGVGPALIPVIQRTGSHCNAVMELAKRMLFMSTDLVDKVRDNRA